MLYFFEDSSSSLISKLYLKSYKDATLFRFVDGAGNLAREVRKALRREAERAVVFMDSVPNNDQILINYEELVTVSRQFPDRLIVLPIVCAEYYFLASLQAQPVYRDVGLVRFCLSKQYYRKLPALIGHEKHALTFERFCKFLCRDYLHKCCYIRTKGDTPEHIRVYNKVDCRCTNCLDGCVPMLIEEKSERLLEQYPCVPLETTFEQKKILSWDALKKLHRTLVDEFNHWVDSYRACDDSPERFYEYLEYMQ